MSGVFNKSKYIPDEKRDLSFLQNKGEPVLSLDYKNRGKCLTRYESIREIAKIIQAHLRNPVYFYSVF